MILEPDTALLIQPGDLHAISVEQPQIITEIVVHPSFWANEEDDELFSGNLRFQMQFSQNDPVDTTIIQHLHSVKKLYDERPFGYEFQLQAQLSGFWCRLLTLADLRNEESSRSDSDIQRIKAMLHHIHEHYSLQLTLKDIADAAAVSERECSRCFQRCFRESAITYLNKYRIRVAAGLLLKTTDSVTAISRQCGFRSASYFGRLFQKLLGCTPKDYRKKASQN